VNREHREFVADWLIVLGALALLLSLFLTWSHQFSPAVWADWKSSPLLRGVPRDPNAWQVYSVVDVLLALLASGLLAIALIGRRGARIVGLVASVIALAFTVHALSVAPTNGANLPNAEASVPAYLPGSATTGAGETVAIVALGAAVIGLLLSFTAD
jgi:hypothetical protein